MTSVAEPISCLDFKLSGKRERGCRANWTRRLRYHHTIGDLILSPRSHACLTFCDRYGPTESSKWIMGGLRFFRRLLSGMFLFSKAPFHYPNKRYFRRLYESACFWVCGTTFAWNECESGVLLFELIQNASKACFMLLTNKAHNAFSKWVFCYIKLQIIPCVLFSFYTAVATIKTYFWKNVPFLCLTW